MNCRGCGNKFPASNGNQRYCGVCRPGGRELPKGNGGNQKHPTVSRSIEERNALVLGNTDIAYSIASKMHARVRGRADFETLLSGAFVGLLDSATRYKPESGTKFTTFASPRVAGQIVDDIRSAQHHSRNVQDARKEMDQAEQLFYAEHGYKPDDDELRAAMGMDERAFSLMATSARLPRETRHDCDSPATADDTVDRADWWTEVARGLNREDKVMILAYYRDGISMKNIATMIGLSESMVSMRIKVLVRRMRDSERIKRLAEVV